MSLLAPTASIERTGRICGGIAAGCGGLALCGWASGLLVLSGKWYASAPPCKPQSALTLLLCGCALWLASSQGRASARAWERPAAAAASVVALLLAVDATLAWAGAWHTGISSWLYLWATGSAAQGRAPQATPFSSLALGGLALAQLVHLSRTGRQRLLVAQLLCIPALLCGVWGLIEFVLRFERAIGISLNTAVGCLTLAAGTLLLQPAPWLAQIAFDRGAVGRTARILPLTLLLPIALGAIPVNLERAGLITERIEEELLVLGMTIGTLVSYWLALRFVQAMELRSAAERQLRAQEARNRLIVETAREGIWLADPAGACTYANPQLELMLGYGPGELVGRTSAGLLEAQDGADSSSPVETGGGVRELQLRRRDGSCLWALVAARPLVTDGQDSGTLLTVTDITERKQTEERVRHSHSVLQATLEAAPDGLIVIERDRPAPTCNRRLVEMFSLSGEFAGSCDSAALFAAIGAQVANQDEYLAGIAAMQDDPGADVFDTLRLGDGRIIERHAVPQLLDGRINGRVIVLRDVTERQRMLEDLHQAQAYLEETQEMGGIGSWAVDLSSGRVYWSKSAHQLLGVDPAQTQASYEAFLAVIHPEDVDQTREASDSVLATGTATALDFRVVLPDGGVRWIYNRAHLVRAVDGSPLRLQGLMQDVTERKQAEEERAKLENQLRQSQKMEAIGTLAGGIAHDFNNILAAILGYAELVLDGLQDAELRSHQQSVLTAANRAVDLVKHILAFSRQTRREALPVRPASVVLEALRLLRASLPATITIKQRILDRDGTVMADPTQLHQVLMNLCTNAGHAMLERGGTLEVGLRPVEIEEGGMDANLDCAAGSYLLLTVKDTGTGIPPDIIDRIFDPFFTTKEVGAGTGLGLSTVHGIVTGMGGQVAVRSELGSGTVFDVYLPKVSPPPSSTPVERRSLPRGRERLLLVDDEVALVRMWLETLSRLGYSVTALSSSEEAWQAFQMAPDSFDLLVTDQTMPGLTGAELAARIREVRPELPVILCTGFSHVMTEEKAREYGLTGFLHKPVSTHDLALALRQALDAPPA